MHSMHQGLKLPGRIVQDGAAVNAMQGAQAGAEGPAADKAQRTKLPPPEGPTPGCPRCNASSAHTKFWCAITLEPSCSVAGQDPLNPHPTARIP